MDTRDIPKDRALFMYTFLMECKLGLIGPHGRPTNTSAAYLELLAFADDDDFVKQDLSDLSPGMIELRRAGMSVPKISAVPREFKQLMRLLKQNVTTFENAIRLARNETFYRPVTDSQSRESADKRSSLS